MTGEPLSEKDLQSALDISIPKPKKQIKDNAIESALLAFDAAVDKKNQGSTQTQRPNFITATLNRFGEWMMRDMSRKTVLLGTAACALLAIALLPSEWQQLREEVTRKSQEALPTRSEESNTVATGDQNAPAATDQRSDDAAGGKSDTSSSLALTENRRANTENRRAIAEKEQVSGDAKSEARRQVAASQKKDAVGGAYQRETAVDASEPAPGPAMDHLMMDEDIPSEGGISSSVLATMPTPYPAPPPEETIAMRMPQPGDMPMMGGILGFDGSAAGAASTPPPAKAQAAPMPGRTMVAPSASAAMSHNMARHREEAARQQAHRVAKQKQARVLAEKKMAQAYAPATRFTTARRDMHKGTTRLSMMPPVVSGQIMPPQPPVVEAQERDRFKAHESNPIRLVTEHPVSTFSADVDSASYSFVRRQINRGRLPSPDAVRVEEMVNYFSYDYATPESPEVPFAPSVSLYTTPWNADTLLLQIGIKGYSHPPSVQPGKLSAHAPATEGEKSRAGVAKPRSNLVFLIDVSGSMRSADKLPLLKQSLGLLINTLKPHDRVAIAVYAGAAGTVLEPTPAKERHKIMAALNNLRAGGSTAGGAGIQLAYSLAQQHFDPQAVNRVILATDGDFNVGISNPRALKQLITRKRESGIFLSVLGFGQGNYNDHLMQELAQNGNGVAAYIDTLNEARKVLVEEASANLFTIAKDVKFQLEFNPKRVAEYRLIGYETRKLKRQDFNNDAVDAGDIGAGHEVTALYEITLAGSPAQRMDPLRYGGDEAQRSMTRATQPATADKNAEYAFLKMRYKLPSAKKSRLITLPITPADRININAASHTDQRFAAAVAAFGQKLKQSPHINNYTTQEILDLALSGKGVDHFGYRAEFINLVRMVMAME